MTKFKNKYRYDYSSFGYYFITICTQDRELFFGNDNVKKIAKQYWLQIPNHFKNTKLDEFIVMPNHIHGIVIINDDIDYCRDAINRVSTQTNINTKIGGITGKRNPMLKQSLGTIIRWHKAKTTCTIRKFVGDEFIKFGYFSWQSNYYERIIRNNLELNRIRRYIKNNPDNWETDRNNPKNFRN